MEEMQPQDLKDKTRGFEGRGYAHIMTRFSEGGMDIEKQFVRGNRQDFCGWKKTYARRV